METTYLFILLVIHYIADFYIQTSEQAAMKSKSNNALTTHVATYSLCFFIFSLILFKSIVISVTIFGITFATHWLTDYITSRESSYYFSVKKNTRAGFQVVGLDQLIHTTTLYFTFNIFL